jgi:hypothetical protein
MQAMNEFHRNLLSSRSDVKRLMFSMKPTPQESLSRAGSQGGGLDQIHAIVARKIRSSGRRTDDMIPKRDGGMAPPGNCGCQQGAKIPFQAGISRYLLALALPASAQERDKVSFKAIPPVIGIETRDNRC